MRILREDLNVRLEEHRDRVRQGMPPSASIFPVVARGVFGPSPAEILEDTKGKPGNFYYRVSLILFWIIPILLMTQTFFFTDFSLDQFIIDKFSFLGIDNTNHLIVVLAFFPITAIIVRILQPLLYPCKGDGMRFGAWIGLTVLMAMVCYFFPWLLLSTKLFARFLIVPMYILVLAVFAGLLAPVLSGNK